MTQLPAAHDVVQSVLGVLRAGNWSAGALFTVECIVEFEAWLDWVTPNCQSGAASP